MSTYPTDVSACVIDLETAPLDNVKDYVEAPSLEDISAPANYKDPVKIDAYIAEAKAKRIADFDRDCTQKAALDFNVARIVALGFWTAESGGTRVWTCQNEAQEMSALNAFWLLSKSRMIVGFRIREFDLPMIIQRSRYLSVPHRPMDLGRYARGARITDLWDLLTFQDLRSECLMRRSLKSFARRFGLAVPADIDGAEVPALIAAGDWGRVAAHCTADVELTVALARRLGVIPRAQTEIAQPTQDAVLDPMVF